MIFGIDVVGALLEGLPMLPGALIQGLPGIFGGLGKWGGCVAEQGLTAQMCQYMH